MMIIRHRRNTTAELNDTPAACGVEIDIRSFGADLVLHHDPFVCGERFEDWILHYRHGTLILNVKEEGLEERVLAVLAQHAITDFFFLDQSFPFLIRTARTGERRCAVRVSEFESAETALAVARLVDWVWVDCFTRFPLDGCGASRLHEAGLKLCLVSPELQGFGIDSIAPFRAHLDELGVAAEAVCTKAPERWQ